MVRGFLLSLVLITAFACARGFAAAPRWTHSLADEANRLEENYPGKVGFFVKDLKTGRTFSHRGTERWYVASGVKVLIAIETLRRAAEGRLGLDSTLTLLESDYVDGAGGTNWRKPGSALSVRYLLGEMLIRSDNTASDLLLKKIGLSSINSLKEKLVPGEFGEITLLSEVRKGVYGRLHPKGRDLNGRNLVFIAATKDPELRLTRLASLLHVKRTELQLPSLHRAFSAFYATGHNSVSLTGYGQLLEQIALGQALPSDESKLLLNWMENATTGARRLKAGLPRKYRFAHKTGTQHERICDLGIAAPPNRAFEEGVIIAACTRELETKTAEIALKDLGRAIAASGLLGR